MKLIKIQILLLFVSAMLTGLPTLYAQTDSLHTDSTVQATVADSIRRDSVAVHADTLRRDSVKPAVHIPVTPDTTLQHFYSLNKWIGTNTPAVLRSEPPFEAGQKDLVFYLLMGVLLVLGFIRLLFSKYFNDLFRIFFQTTFRQKSIREQLLQNKMASLLLNIFFCISGGMFLYFVAVHRGWLQPEGLLKKMGLCMALVAIVYTTKYIGLRISGWLFGMRDVTETYLFIVFLINKVVGVLLLPATLMLALGTTSLQSVLLVISFILLITLYMYRYLIALPLVRNHSALTGFHFFVYLCAFEVVPVLLMYKLLILNLSS